jgi:hypothetical protein
MFLLFFLSWASFFSMNLAMGVCPTCQFNQLLFKWFLWLGYASSILNPIIYTVFNRAFKRTFVDLLTCSSRLCSSTSPVLHRLNDESAALCRVVGRPHRVPVSSNARGSSGVGSGRWSLRVISQGRKDALLTRSHGTPSPLSLLNGRRQRPSHGESTV